MAVATVKVCQDFVQGDSFDVKITHNPGFDITSAIFKLTLAAEEHGYPVMEVTHVVPAGADATAGIATMTISVSDTASIGPGEYFASLKRTLSGGSAKTILRSGMRTSEGALIKKVEVFKKLDY